MSETRLGQLDRISPGHGMEALRVEWSVASEARVGIDEDLSGEVELSASPLSLPTSIELRIASEAIVGDDGVEVYMISMMIST
ncbi:hypothetical protein PRNP1_002522 [Phytophthora ramorum]